MSANVLAVNVPNNLAPRGTPTMKPLPRNLLFTTTKSRANPT